MAGTDFSATVIPDMVGTLRGLRVFKVDHTGRLKSLYYTHRWTTGVNLAYCLPTSLFDPGIRRSEPENVGHDGWIDCRCGLYAYTDGSNTYRQSCDNPDCASSHHRQVSGLIEAWGRMVVGPRGFRAEKARIVALIMPDGVWATVWLNYPVPVFPTEADALAEFPLTPTEGLAAA